MKQKLLARFALIIALILPAAFFIYGNTTATYAVSSTEAEEVPELTEKEIYDLTSAYMDKLTQEIDDQYRVKQFDTKEELLNSFDEVALREASEPVVDYYFTEEADGLYILPTETPAWFVKGNDCEIETANEKYVTITQSNSDPLYGDYTIQMSFSYKAGQWKIAAINYL